MLVGSSFAFSLLNGRISALSAAITNSAVEAVDLSISMLGITCLWKGLIAVLDEVGAVKALCRIFRPILRLIYPNSFSSGIASDEICTNFAANFLGLGNAALPFGISAVEKLSLCDDNELTTFAVLATVPIQLVPTTLIALRSSAGAQDPHSILFPILASSLATYAFAVMVCKVWGKIARARK